MIAGARGTVRKTGATPRSGDRRDVGFDGLVTTPCLEIHYVRIGFVATASARRTT